MLECRGGGVYAGIAKDVDKRYVQHRRGVGAKYTQIHPPVGILARLPYPSYGAARRAELLVKRLKPALKKEWATRIREKGEVFPVLAEVGSEGGRCRGRSLR